MNVKNLPAALALALPLSLFNVAHGQEALKSAEEEYYDFLSINGVASRPTLGYRTLSDSVWTVDSGEDEEAALYKNPWGQNNLGRTWTLFKNENASENAFLLGLFQGIKVRAYGPDFFGSYNTKFPYGQNDGGLWQGRGLNASLSAGARLESYGFELTFKPQISYSQNYSFEKMPGVSGTNDCSYFWGSIDLPQRFGTEPFWNFDWGDSEVRWSWRSFTVGFGTQNPWLGPAWLNPMLGSNNASGFPKIDIGFRRTKIFFPHWDWFLGELEARVWAGRLKESDYYDSNSENDYRLLNGLSISYTPPFWQGFTVGMNRVFISKWESKNLKYIGRLFTGADGAEDPNANGAEDQKISFFAHQIIPSFGFEVYGELGIDDFTSNRKSNPFHTAIYTVGARKTFNIYKPWGITGELIFEWNNFEMSQDFQLQWPYMGFYGHGSQVQGYTHRGQILGAGTGYAGNSQFLGFRAYFPKGSAMVFFHRSCPDNNFIYSKAVNADASYPGKINDEFYAVYRTFLEYGIEGLYFATPSLQLSAGVSYVNYLYYNYYHTEEDDSRKGHRAFRFKFGLKYSI